MIDFHSHFLPNMDDGSRSVEESLEMLKISYSAGIEAIISTPHFSADIESVEEFLNRRKTKLNLLTGALEAMSNIPQIICGAEVAFYPGMSGNKELTRLCIGNTKYLLIEMPYYGWSLSTKKELLSLMLNWGITPLLAHVDRYLSNKHCEKIIEELLNVGAVVQINSEGLLNSKKKRRKVLKLIKERRTVVLGSDCHNMDDRRPDLDKALRMIENKIGRKFLDRIDQFSREILLLN